MNKFFKILFIPFWIVLIIAGIKVLDIEPDGMTSYLIGSTIAGIIGFLYFYLKNFILIKYLRAYIEALKNRQFSDALTYGRVYYSVKRKGIFASNGSGLTVFDESAITNDINAYSRSY